jgi:4'-phosphopantetheinyl transferase
MFKAIILHVNKGIEKADFERLQRLVSPIKQERICKFRFMEDATNCLLGDLLVRYEICRHNPNIDMRQVEICEDENGKPYVKNPHGFHFNISHSGKSVALVCSDEMVGIDIEIIKPIEYQSIAERYFTEDEAVYIQNSGGINGFYDIWTKKESRIKCEGVGLSKKLSSFSVLTETLNDDFKYYNIYKTDEAVCHVCSMNDCQPLVEIIYSDEFIRKILMAM